MVTPGTVRTLPLILSLKIRGPNRENWRSLSPRMNISQTFAIALLWAVAQVELRAQDQVPNTLMNKETLASRVQRLEPNLAEIIRSADTRIEVLETPFFRKGTIYLVVYMGPHHPLAFTVGCAEPDFTVLLPANPEGFVQLAGKSDLRLDSDRLRISYVIVFLESTRDFARRFQILNRFDDIQLIARPTEQEKQRYEKLRNAYESAVRPPTIILENEEWKVMVIALKGQDLVRLEIKLFDNGKVTVGESIIERDLPINYAK